MLSIDQRGPSIRGLTRLKQQRIAGRAVGGLCRRHGAKRDRAFAQLASTRNHQHALAERAVGAARAGLVGVRQNQRAVQHGHPVAPRAVDRFHRTLIRLPTRAGCVASHWVRAEVSCHTHGFRL